MLCLDLLGQAPAGAGKEARTPEASEGPKAEGDDHLGRLIFEGNVSKVGLLALHVIALAHDPSTTCALSRTCLQGSRGQNVDLGISASPKARSPGGSGAEPAPTAEHAP